MITAQLIDTKSGSHLWTERYDRSLAEIFVIQDEITATIDWHLVRRDRQREPRACPIEAVIAIEAYDLYLMACRFSQLPRTVENVKQAFAYRGKGLTPGRGHRARPQPAFQRHSLDVRPDQPRPTPTVRGRHRALIIEA